jgi:hypothetical protein
MKNLLFYAFVTLIITSTTNAQHIDIGVNFGSLWIDKYDCAKVKADYLFPNKFSIGLQSDIYLNKQTATGYVAIPNIKMTLDNSNRFDMYVQISGHAGQITHNQLYVNEIPDHEITEFLLTLMDPASAAFFDYINGKDYEFVQTNYTYTVIGFGGEVGLKTFLDKKQHLFIDLSVGFKNVVIPDIKNETVMYQGKVFEVAPDEFYSGAISENYAPLKDIKAFTPFTSFFGIGYRF